MLFEQTSGVSKLNGSQLRSIPSVDRILAEIGPTEIPRPLVVATIRRQLQLVRQRHADGDGHPEGCTAIEEIQAALEKLRRSRLQPVINGTGVIIHTNLGRSPLGVKAVEALTAAASNYCNLEYDLDAGTRGQRGGYLQQCLALLCDAPAAMVVNNCAAALTLILYHFATKPPRTQVVISRGELVQIGGGFRVPDILLASGAALCEVGTTNITTPADYERAIGEQTAMILRVHPSNFAMTGFVRRPSTDQLAAITRRENVLLVEDLGSGATFDTRQLGGDERERTPAQTLADGADLVCFSGDKLLGGPQAGIIAGREDLVAALKADPYFRALRCDKLVLAALEATVELHLDGMTDQIPIRAMMHMPIEQLAARAGRIIHLLHEHGIEARTGQSQSQTGGGSLPRTLLPSVTIDLVPPASRRAEDLAAALRDACPPLIAFIAEQRVKIDLRTVFESRDADVVAAIVSAMQAF